MGGLPGNYAFFCSIYKINMPFFAGINLFPNLGMRLPSKPYA
jgi:hypothetical protein